VNVVDAKFIANRCAGDGDVGSIEEGSRAEQKQPKHQQTAYGETPRTSHPVPLNETINITALGTMKGGSAVFDGREDIPRK
jgi:hypothetical protein